MRPTEMQVDIKLFADGKCDARGITLVIARWQLFKDGTSLRAVLELKWDRGKAILNAVEGCTSGG